MFKMLAEIKVNKKKVIQHISIRMAFVIFMGLGWFCALQTSKTGKSNYIGLIIVVALLSVYALSPLRYLNRVLVFQNNKIAFGKKELIFDDLADIQWMKRKTYYAGTRMVVYKKSQEKGLKAIITSCNDEIDVTYMKNPKDEFVRCYMNNVR